MAEVASINRVTQWGSETTAGTEVDATKLMQAMTVDFGPEVEVSRYRPSGGKFETVSSLDREWTGADLSGPITYTEIIYPLSSILKKVNPTGAGTPKTWTFSPAQTAADTIATYTVEVGSSVRAQLMTYGIVTELELSFSTQGNTLSGAMIGRAIQDNITLTASPSALALLPVLTKDISVKTASAQGSLTAATPLARVISASWAIRNRFGPVWVLNQSTSWAAHVELPIEGEITIRQQADAEGMGFLNNLHDGSTVFIRIGATSAIEVDTGVPYSIRIDAACKVVGSSRFEDEEGQTVIEWTLGIVYDATWTKATEVTVVNALTAL